MAHLLKIRAVFLSGLLPSTCLQRSTTRFCSLLNRRSYLEFPLFTGKHSKLFYSSSSFSPSLPPPPNPSTIHGPRFRVITEDDEEYPEYPWIEDVERLDGYKPGGYHPVMIGDLLHERYRIVDKLGFGGYSTIWLAQDTQLNCYVAVKVGISSWAPHEITALKALSTPSPPHPGRAFIPSVLDTFEVHGPNSTHSCYTTDVARCSLHEASFSLLFSLEVTRALVYGLTMAVVYTHSRGYVHGGAFNCLFILSLFSRFMLTRYFTLDIHLRNVLFKLPSFGSLSIDQFYEEYGKPDIVTIERKKGKPLPPNLPPKAVSSLYLGKDAGKFSLAEAQIILSDFGEAFAPATTVREGKNCHTPLDMRPPETRFEPHKPLSFSSDIWSLAHTIWAIIGIKPLFGDDFGQNPDRIASQHLDALGPMPIEWWNSWETRSHYFHENGVPLEGRHVWPPLAEWFEVGVQKYRWDDGLGEFDKDESAAILDILRRMLSYRPEQRPTAEEVLNSEWMVKWGLPCFEQSLQEQ